MRTRCVGPVALAVASAANAQTVLNFDELGLPDDTVITDQYADEGVIFSAPGGDAVVITASFPIFPLEPQGLYSNAGDQPFFMEPIVADIADGASMVGVWIDFGSVVSGMKIEAFDGFGGTGQLLGSDSTTSETFISVSALIIRSVVISQVNDEDSTTYLIDNFTFDPLACFEILSEDLTCHTDGTTFTYTVDGVDACTGGMETYSFTASGGAVGEELCFSLLVTGEEGDFCCSTEICVTIPDCTPAAQGSDLDGDGIVGMVDLLALLAAWGSCIDCGTCPADFDGDCSVGILDLLVLLGNWG